MKLSPLQHIIISIGYKVDVTEQFRDKNPTSLCANEVISDGTKIYCGSMPGLSMAHAEYGNLYTEPSIFLNKRNISHYKNDYLFESGVEHECAHVKQMKVLNKIYGRKIFPIEFDIPSQFSLNLLLEGEAHSYQFIKACKHYKLSGDFTKLDNFNAKKDYDFLP